MASELIREFKLQNDHLKQFNDLECDSLADYTFFFGDMNYRLNSTFEHLSTHMEETKNQSLDQLFQSMTKFIQYPCYEEGDIAFAPTYKLSSTKVNQYVNKKNQAPSFTDRVLFRNNSASKI